MKIKLLILFMFMFLKGFSQCEIMDAPPLPTLVFPQFEAVADATKCVNLYIETDYDVYVYFGSKAAVITWVNGWFAQVKTIYSKDGININLQTLVVWTTVDPYVGTTTADYSLQFQQYSQWKVNSTSKGNVALLINLGGQGGRAFVNTLCYNTYAGLEYCTTGYCSVNASYAVYPTYSFTVECIAHELGHLSGSPHTHACAWNGNNTAIDGCYTSEGTCAQGLIPTKGTIMSYCHLTVGIDFLLGFGTQPKTLIQSKISAATCLTACSNPLPIELRSYYAKDRVLYWTTSSEHNCHHFTIYKCNIDFSSWQVIGEVKAVENSTVENTYHFPIPEGKYFGLSHTDLDGALTKDGWIILDEKGNSLVYNPLEHYNYLGQKI